MKRFVLLGALVALLAGLVVGVVPGASVGAQDEAGTQAAPADVHIVNTAPASIDVWDSTDGGTTFTGPIATAIPAGVPTASSGEADVQVAAGNHVFKACVTGGASGCASIAGGPVSAVIQGGGNYTLAFTGALNAIASNDTSPTDFGYGRFTLNNLTGGAFAASYDDGSGCTAIEGLGASPGQGVIEIPAQQDLDVYLGVPNCVGPPATPFDIAAGVNLVITLPAAAQGTCTTECAQSILVGQIAADSTDDVPEFCSVIDPDFLDLQAELERVFGGNAKNDPDTLLALADDIDALVAKGNESVPPEIADAWGRISTSFLQLSSAIQAAGGDWSLIPPDQQQQIEDFATGTGETDPQTEADTETLTNWFLENCLEGVIEATPTFTG